MTAVFSTVLLAVALGAEPSGVGLPLGIPPGPADPVIARVAPEKCLFYVNWAGSAAPDPNSSSQAEQLLAEPEVQQLLAGVGKGIKAAMIGATKEASASKWVSGEEAFEYLSILLTHPTAIFISDVKITKKEAKSVVAATKKAPAEDSPEVLEVHTSVKLDIRGGMLVSLGPQAAGIKAAAEKSLDKFLRWYKCEEVTFEHVQIAGQTWYRVRSKLGAGGPSVVFGFKGDRFIVGFGDGSLEAILARIDRAPPAWLAAALANVPVERRTGVIYLNLKALRETFIGSQLDTPDCRAIFGMLGLDNAEAVVSTTGLDASGYVNKALLALEGPPRGLLRLVSDRPLRPEDLAPIPRDATLALAVRFDLQQALEIILSSLDAMSPERRAGVNQAFDQIGRDLGVDLRRGLLPAVGDTWCIYNSPGEGGLVVTGLTAVVPVRNHQVLSAAYGNLVDLVKKNLAAGPDAGSAFGLAGLSNFRHFTFAGREICSVNCGFLAPAWCLTPRELVMALSPHNVKAYLSRREHKSLATAPEVARVLGLSGGPVMIGYTDAPKLFELFYPLVSMYVPAIVGIFDGPLSELGLPSSPDTPSGKLDLLSFWPSAPSISRHLRPEVTTLQRTARGIEITCHYSFPTGGVNVPAFCLLGAGLSPGLSPLVVFLPDLLPAAPEVSKPGDASEKALEPPGDSTKEGRPPVGKPVVPPAAGPAKATQSPPVPAVPAPKPRPR
jgi:hypothetical protein